MRRVFITCNSISSSTSIFELYSDFRKTTFIFFSDFVNVCAANVQLRPFLSFLFLFPCERSLLGISEEKRTCVLSLTSLFNFAQHSQIIMERRKLLYYSFNRLSTQQCSECCCSGVDQFLFFFSFMKRHVISLHSKSSIHFQVPQN